VFATVDGGHARVGLPVGVADGFELGIGGVGLMETDGSKEGRAVGPVEKLGLVLGSLEGSNDTDGY